VLSDRGHCNDGPINRLQESYRIWRVCVRPLIPDNEEALAHYGLLCHRKEKR